MNITETFKSQTDEERRQAVTDLVVNLENNNQRRHEVYAQEERSQHEKEAV
jgi:hypothetical protein